jgi:hypothetical protein
MSQQEDGRHGYGRRGEAASGRSRDERSRSGRYLAVAAALVAAALLSLPSLASADYEQVPQHFGEALEEVTPLTVTQLYGAWTVAVNAAGTQGADGVEPGTIYVGIQRDRVLRFSAGTEGEAPQFEEAWGWGVGNGKSEFQRCGPAYAQAPRPEGTFSACLVTPSDFGSGGGEEPGDFLAVVGLAVDQATGDVYVHTPPIHGTKERHLVEVFSPRGTPIGEGFGEVGRQYPEPSESIAEGPEKLHAQTYDHGIAVDEAGTVYLTDSDFAFISGPRQNRVMVFEPAQPGDFAHYVYAGEGSDITNTTEPFKALALVGTSRLVAASETFINEYPTGGGSTPICSYSVSGQLKTMTANPTTGEVFYFVGGAHALHRLGPCNESTGKFAEAQGPLEPTPLTHELDGLAVNPSLSWGPLRPAGVLYGVNFETIGNTLAGVGDVFAPARNEGLSPEVVTESVAHTTSISSILQAQINPRGSTTNYRFQYLTQAQYEANGGGFALGAVEVPISAVDLGGSGVAAEPVSGLEPDTAYRFRVVAENECNGSGDSPCVGFGVPASFRTYPLTMAGLPDQRAYELVSPAQKDGGEVFPADPSTSSCLAECKPPGFTGIYSVFPMESTPGGDAVSYMGFPFSPTEGAATFNSYISRRTATGWHTTAMSPRRLNNQSSLAYSDSLGDGAITMGEPELAESAPAGYRNLYLQDAEDPAAVQPVLTKELFETLQHSPHSRPYREKQDFHLAYQGHSPEFAAQYFTANDSLTSTAAYAPEPEDPGQTGEDLYEVRGGNLALVNVLPGNAAVAPGASFASASPDTHAVSTGGYRVFWEAGGRLYVREDNRTTREVHHAGSFLAASPDGLEVLLSDGCLYSLATAECGADLTQGQGGFLGIAGQSEDFSKIYFVDSAALPGENERGEEAKAGEPNLYLHETGKGARFIATLTRSDSAGASAEELFDWAAAPGERTAEASPDGRYLAFGSSMQLTGHDNIGPCKKSQKGGHAFFFEEAPCHEVFLYDAATGKFTCPSCNPTGEAPLGNSTLRRIFSVETNRWLPQPHYLTDQGRLFFDSSDRLSPNDTNGRVEDVYEAEPKGIGSCARAAGCVFLISSGTGSVDSNLLAMDESGNNVFFTTRERLAKQDTDELIDVYDARVDGGFRGDAEAAPAECRGEACQATAASFLPVPLSGSLAFSGAGNILAPTLSKPVTKQKPLTKAQELAKVLKACRKEPKKQRPSCERTARRKYGASTKAKKSARRTSNHKHGGAK